MNFLRPQAGFSLLEMVVAVAILGISLGMLYQAAGGAVRGVSAAEDHSYAIIMAQSLLAAHSSVPPDGLSGKGQTDDGFSWELSTRPVLRADGQEVQLKYLDVWVRWGRNKEVHLPTVVPVEVVPQ
ncbi:type IV pilus modification PilV family protein [Gilvimarinus chinensis]|uniref:type IV pilus modification PilV family protein n=1 Tax=Gilvimarinus chinensis TaxID=396005 RepID=UPI00036D3E60|nr:prepilin-type N-terminal cleavage/methylation domain-containing protein [Gilvimarinus chinensis]